MIISLLCCFLSYIIGSIPFGLFYSSFFIPKGDLTTTGSGNIGATNVLRVVGKLPAIMTLLSDVLKGFIVVCFISLLDSFLHPIFYGFVATIGHIFPIWLRFRGGKGVATGLGVFLGLDLLFGLLVCLIWFITFVCFRYSSLAAIVSFICSPFLSIFFFHSVFVFNFAILLAFVVIIKHKSNIIRLVRGEENGFNSHRRS